MKIIITKVESNRVTKFLPVSDEAAQSKLDELLPAYPSAFVYDGEYLPELWVENGVVTTQPLAEPQSSARTQFTSLEFLDRFTENEQLAVVQATMQSAAVKLWYDRLLAASFIDLLDPRTEAGIDALIGAGLIAGDRKAALLQPA